MSGAHTDGDVIVFFRKSDVVSAGDVFATDGYPQINVDEGANVNRAISALNRIIDIAVAEFRQQGGTMIIPGHGRLYDETDVVEYRDMLSIVRDRVQMLLKEGKTLEQIKMARPALDYDALYDTMSAGSWTSDMFENAIYRSLTSGSNATAGAKTSGAK